jgi:TPR repeat protein
MYASMFASSEEIGTGLEPLDRYSKELCSTYPLDADADKHDQMGALPLCYVYGFSRVVNLEKARDIYLSRAEQRPWNYTLAAGVVFLEIKQADQYPMAADWLELGIKNGDISGKPNCYLGLLYLTGRVVPKNMELASKHLAEARERGDATCILVSYYLFSTGEYNFEKSPQKASQLEEWIAITSPTLKSQKSLRELFPVLDSYIEEFGLEWESI